ncbi:MAG TPA: hemolysin family protein [Candidatus Xenobia bacterium]|jgi:CBS domain containing-hemolysin-like protein
MSEDVVPWWLPALFSTALMLLESSLESALAAVNRARIRQMAEEEARWAQRLDHLLEERPRLVSTLNSMRTLLVMVTGFTLCWGLHGWTSPWSMLGIFMLLMAGLLVLEIWVRRVAAAHAEGFMLRITPLLAWLRVVSQRGLPPSTPEETGPTEQDIRLMVEEGRDIEDTEKEMIHSILGLSETIAREIMVPRVDMVCVEANTPIARVLDLAVSSGHSRIPVYEGTIDSILGIAYTRDMFTMLHDRKRMDRLVRDCVRPAFIVHGTKKVDDLLREMQKEKATIAIVVDEYGGTDGLLTMEDVIEEIVGEITDEYDKEIPAVEKMDDGSIIVDAKMIIEDVNEVLDADLPSNDYETIGGYVYGLMGHVPVQGEQASTDGLVITVEKVNRQRIMKIRLQKTAESPAAGAETSPHA